MYTSELTVMNGVKVLWEGTIREASYAMKYIMDVDDSWSEAQMRGEGITKQMVQDWLDEMSAQGRIEFIDPITFVQTFDRGMMEAHNGSPFHFEDTRILSDEAPRKVAPIPEDSLMNKAIRLIFDATGSQERAVRILRAYEEPYAFVHLANGDWSCTNKEQKAYRLYCNINNSSGYCTCQDFQTRGLQQRMPCKHLYGYVIQTNKVSWKPQETGQEQE